MTTQQKITTVSVAITEDLRKAMSSLKNQNSEEDAVVLQRATEASIAHQLMSRAGTGKPYPLACDEAAKASTVLLNLMASGYDVSHAAVVCRALFAEQSDEDMEQAFHAFDAENTHTVKMEEVKKILPAVGMDLTTLKLHQFLKDLGFDRAESVTLQEFGTVMRSANPLGSQESYFSRLPSLGVGATLFTLASGVSHMRDAYVAGLDDLSTFELRRAGVILENFAAAGMPREMAVAVCRSVLGDQDDDAMKAAFMFLDKDNSGAIDKEEFKNCFPLLGEDVSEESLKELYAMADKNKSGTLEFREFVDLVKAMNPKPAPTPATQHDEAAPAPSADGAAAPVAAAAEGAAPASDGNFFRRMLDWVDTSNAADAAAPADATKPAEQKAEAEATKRDEQKAAPAEVAAEAEPQATVAKEPEKQAEAKAGDGKTA